MQLLVCGTLLCLLATINVLAAETGHPSRSALMPAIYG
jgi:hypothetical protein